MPGDENSDVVPKDRQLDEMLRRALNDPPTRQFIGEAIERGLRQSPHRPSPEQIRTLLDQLPQMIRVECNSDWCIYNKRGCTLREIKMMQQQSWPLNVLCGSYLRGDHRSERR